MGGTRHRYSTEPVRSRAGFERLQHFCARLERNRARFNGQGGARNRTGRAGDFPESIRFLQFSFASRARGRAFYPPTIQRRGRRGTEDARLQSPLQHGARVFGSRAVARWADRGSESGRPRRIAARTDLHDPGPSRRRTRTGRLSGFCRRLARTRFAGIAGDTHRRFFALRPPRGAERAAFLAARGGGGATRALQYSQVRVTTFGIRLMAPASSTSP